MNALLLYMFKSTLCVSMLYAIYWFFLRRETFFQWNRCYLLSMVLFAGFFPLLPLRLTFSYPMAPVAVMLEPVMITPEKVAQTLLTKLQWIEVVAVVYMTGVLLLFLRLCLQLIQLQLIIRRYGVMDRQGHRVVFLDRGYAPFSFFNLIFINESVVSTNSFPTILEHEQIHIRQYHTLDMILIELATIFQWFNPVIWMAGMEMKSIHEYLADEGVLQNGTSRSTYQQMILEEAMGIRVNSLTNNFNVSLLKKRITMMTKSKSKTWAKSKVFIALPVLMVLLFILTARSYSNSKAMNDTGARVQAPVQLLSDPDPVVQNKQKQQTQIKYTPVDTSQLIYKNVEKMPSYPGGDEARLKFLIENIKYPEAAIKNNVQGKVFMSFIVRADGSVTDVKVMRGSEEDVMKKPCAWSN